MSEISGALSSKGQLVQVAQCVHSNVPKRYIYRACCLLRWLDAVFPRPRFGDWGKLGTPLSPNQGNRSRAERLIRGNVGAHAHQPNYCPTIALPSFLATQGARTSDPHFGRQLSCHPYFLTESDQLSVFCQFVCLLPCFLFPFSELEAPSFSFFGVGVEL